MFLPPAPAQYDKTDQDHVRGQVTAEDAKNIKRTDVLDKLLFRDTATGLIKTVVVTSGAFVIT